MASILGRLAAHESGKPLQANPQEPTGRRSLFATSRQSHRVDQHVAQLAVAFLAMQAVRTAARARLARLLLQVVPRQLRLQRPRGRRRLATGPAPCA